ncbi:MAG: YicC/YloC family endoribonuclease [Chlamydiota bacterium]|nr:YicC/YloC family endoribonuclease [Chlamydiota bacterium]
MMIRSMTGFGRCERNLDNARIVFEIYAVNKKNIEINFNLPKIWVSFENEFLRAIQNQIHRGKINVTMEYFPKTLMGEFCINLELAKQYKEILQNIISSLNLRDDVHLKDILSNKDILMYQKKEDISQDDCNCAKEVLQGALEQFLNMRQTEGLNLHKDLSERCDHIIQRLESIKSLAPQSNARYEERLRKRLQELFTSKEELDVRLIREVALMSERVDITEEIVRMKSHLEQFESTLQLDGSVGRILDFILQELLREINTMGAKSDDMQISKLVIDIKNELDKIREQVQNVE